MTNIIDKKAFIDLDGTVYDTIESNNVLEIQIIGDGNCYYRCLSQELDKTQENYQYYRNLIYNYIVENKDALQKFFFKEDFETIDKYNERYESFIQSIKINHTYAGDFEIASSSIILNKKIIIYYNTLTGYKLLNQYSPNESINTIKYTIQGLIIRYININNRLPLHLLTQIVNTAIYINYRNNNHFNLLQSKNSTITSNELGLYELNKIHKKIEKNQNKINIHKIDSNSFKRIFNKKYVKYRRKECPELYTEIYNYLKYEELPIRLISPFMQNVEIYRNKKISNEIINKDDNPYIKKNNTEKDSNKREKRKSFRELIQNKYTIKNDRLYYKYERCKGKILEKKFLLILNCLIYF